jgi:hypothetical protein
MADRKISDLTALTTPASGDYLPIVDISESAAASKNKRITIQSLFQGIPVNVGIGTTSPGSALHVYGGPAEIRVESSTGSDGFIRFTNTSGSMSVGMTGAALNGFLLSDRTNNHVAYQYIGGASGAHVWNTNNAERLRIDSSGRVGIGTTSPGESLDIVGNIRSTNGFVRTAGSSANAVTTRGFRQTIDGTELLAIYHDNNGAVFNVNTSERARIDSSGRLLVGTSTARSIGAGTFGVFEVEQAGIAIATINTNTNGAEPAILVLGKSRGTTIGSSTVVQSNDQLGEIRFAGGDGTDVISLGASILAAVDGTPGANDMPGRLVFSVTADGAASPTEALRISNDRSITVSDGGNVVLGTTTGTKIGTATTQKLGFYNATPVVQPTAVADATDAATVITQLNALLTRMRNLGLIAT